MKQDNKTKIKGICIIPKDQKSMKKFVDKTGKLVEEYLDVFDYGYKEGVKKTRQEFSEKKAELIKEIDKELEAISLVIADKWVFGFGGKDIKFKSYFNRCSKDIKEKVEEIMK